MIGELYVYGNSALHRLGAGYKLLLLMGIGTFSFFVKSPIFFALALCVVAVLYLCAGLTIKDLFKQLKPIWLFILIIFTVEYYFESLTSALVVVGRLTFLVLFAALVTLTTKVTEMVDALERGLYPFRAVIPVKKVALAIMLTIRFIPLVYGITQELKIAHKARGQKPHVHTMVIPVIIRTLRMADEIAQALYARGFNGK